MGHRREQTQGAQEEQRRSRRVRESRETLGKRWKGKKYSGTMNRKEKDERRERRREDTSLLEGRGLDWAEPGSEARHTPHQCSRLSPTKSHITQRDCKEQ